jgi:hypothetical protein
MNNTTTHLGTNVAAWVEHEESIVVSLLKKALRRIECETGTIITLGLIGVCIAGIIVRLIQISPYFQLIYGCN